MIKVREKTRMLVISAMLVAVAATLSVLDGMIPIQLVVPIPGLKLGLANIVTIFAIFYLGTKPTFTIVVLRCVLGAALAGGFSTFAFSLSGATVAAGIMLLLKMGYEKHFSLYGISLAGSAAFNIMQVMVASIILQDTAVFSYLPVIMTGGVVTGVLTATVFNLFYRRMEKSKAIKNYISF